MARASDCLVELDLERLPLMRGASELARQGIASSLQPQNTRIRHSIEASADFSGHAHYPLLFDPQTAGGLLASVAAESAQDCLQQLRELGYSEAQIIGRALAPEELSPVKNGIRIRLSRF
jgi:selenide,water dikinase